MRIEGVMSAEFEQDNGESRPGIIWSVGLKLDNKVYKAMVKTFLTDDATPETRADQVYQGRTVMQYLNDRINGGWHPEQVIEHTIDIGNPLSPSDQ
jgi:hypothetical protein